MMRKGHIILLLVCCEFIVVQCESDCWVSDDGSGCTADYILRHGKCCPCENGTIGPNCSSRCPRFHYGKFCSSRCNCAKSMDCDPRDGSCNIGTTMRRNLNTGEDMDSNCPWYVNHPLVIIAGTASALLHLISFCICSSCLYRSRRRINQQAREMNDLQEGIKKLLLRRKVRNGSNNPGSTRQQEFMNEARHYQSIDTDCVEHGYTELMQRDDLQTDSDGYLISAAEIREIQSYQRLERAVSDPDDDGRYSPLAP